MDTNFVAHCFRTPENAKLWKQKLCESRISDLLPETLVSRKISLDKTGFICFHHSQETCCPVKKLANSTA